MSYTVQVEVLGVIQAVKEVGQCFEFSMTFVAKQVIHIDKEKQPMYRQLIRSKFFFNVYLKNSY